MYFRKKTLRSFPYSAHEVIRWRYKDGVTKAVILGRVRDDEVRLPAGLLAKLTEAENDEATAWWAAHVDFRRITSTSAMARSAVRVDRVQSAVDEKLMTPEIAAVIYADLERVGAVLRKAGHKAPKKAPKAAPSIETLDVEATSAI